MSWSSCRAGADMVSGWTYVLWRCAFHNTRLFFNLRFMLLVISGAHACFFPGRQDYTVINIDSLHTTWEMPSSPAEPLLATTFL